MTQAIPNQRPAPVVAVIPFGGAPLLVAKVVAAHVSGYLDLEAEVLPPAEIPPSALDEKRLQYNAATLIQAIEAMALDDYFKILALFDVDLFIPLFTHVFGEARQNGRVALISLFRLQTNPKGSSPSTEQVFERIAKIGLHELGHLLDVLHCDDDRCLMHFCGDVDALDCLDLNFCRYCRLALHRKIGSLAKSP